MRITHRLKVLRSGALLQTLRQLKALRQHPHSPWRRPPSPGHLRGIDFYPLITLIWVMASAMRQYFRTHKVYPSIVSPRSFNEKIFWFKFFGELKVPEAGNKLRTSSFIPTELRDRLTCPRVAWESHVPTLPANEHVEPGTYYLKANLGSDMFERVNFPISNPQRQALEAKAQGWLNSKFGFDHGEWWYNAFEPKIMLEHSINGNEDSISWNFYVINGRIPVISMYLKRADGSKSSTWVDADFRPLPWQSSLPLIENYQITARHHEMLEMALIVGRPFPSVRVDFFEGDGGEIYLGELTFSTANGLGVCQPEVDALISTPWTTLH